MDEPLGALDKKLRDSLQREIKHLHGNLGITVIYVTHDQEEAMTIADDLAIKRKRLDQRDSSRSHLFKTYSQTAASRGLLIKCPKVNDFAIF